MNQGFDPEAALDEALARHQIGAVEDAERLYRRVLHAEPDHPDALNFLGVLLQDTGDYPGSESCLRRAVELIPDFAEALTNLARVLQITGQPQAAADAARRAIDADPDLAPAYLQCGRALLDLNDHAAAAAVLRAAIDRDSANPEAQACLGMALLGLRQPDDAEDAYRAALRLDPANMAAHAGLAFALRGQNRLPEAIEAARQALRGTPDRTDLWLLQGQMLANLGRFTEAAACARAALTIDPGSARALRDLAVIGALGAADSDGASLQATLRDPSASLDDRITAAFATGNILDRAGAYDEAFAAYAEANRLMHDTHLASARAYDAGKTARLAAWLRTTFTPDLFACRGGSGVMSDDLVFIVGMPRSGTSLVEQIAASHPAVFGCGEQKSIGTLVDRLNGPGGQRSPETWPRQDCRIAAQHCLDDYRTVAGQASRIIDKMPDNLFLLGHIALLFPNARVILCGRDPRDICLSAYCQHFGDDMVWSYSLTDSAEQAHAAASVAAHWRQVLPLRMLTVDYETLVSDLDGESRRIIDFLDLPWDPACLTFHKTDRAVTTASFWQVKQPLYATSVARWTRYRRHLTDLIFSLLGIIPDPDTEDWDRLLSNIRNALTIAVTHHRAGRLGAAEQIYRAVLDHDPRDAMALHLMGIFFLNQGQFQPAAAWLLRAREVKPADPKLLADLARTHNALHDNAKAASFARTAIALDATFADAWCQLGHALIETGDAPGAVAAMQKSHTLAPREREPMVGLAALLLRLKRLPEAEAVWRSGIAIFPIDADLLAGLSRTLTEQGRHADSVQANLQAISLAPRSAGLHVQLGSVFLRGQEVQNAIAPLRQAVALDPQAIDGWLLLAYALAMLGDHQEAAHCYRAVLAIDPDNGEALTGLVDIGRNEPSDQVIAAGQRIMDNPASSRANQAAAGFALAQALEKQGDYNAAFNALQTANRLVRAERGDIAADQSVVNLRQLVDAMIQHFPNRATQDRSRFATDSTAPTFIVGLPRSGTTLVEQIISGHPDVAGLGEKGDFLKLLDAGMPAMLLTPPERWNADQVKAASADFIASLLRDGGGAMRIVNKSPSNVYWLGQITALFPNARIILCRRDLRDVCWSCYAQHFFEPMMSWTDTLEDCAAHAREIQRLIDHWRLALPGQFLEIHYEDVVEDIEREARRLLEYLGLAWDPACLAFNESKRVVMTASHWQVRQPLYATSVARWRHYRAHLQPLFDELRGLVPDDA